LNAEELRRALESLDGAAPRAQGLPLVERLLDLLESGEVRAAEPTAAGWRVHAWVKRGILLGFKIGENRADEMPPSFHFRDRDPFPTWNPNGCGRDVRIVPGGSTVRRGSHLAEGVVMMPPSYVNVGAFVGAGSMIDSHVLVGSCAQIGSGVHLSAAVQVGGVLEPVGALPVIVEDGAFLGGGSAVFEGSQVSRDAVLAPGVQLTRAVSVYDLVRETIHRAEGERPLIIPPGAVVVPGSRPAGGAFAERLGLQLQTPVIVKYRDRSTDAALVLEQSLR